MAAMQVSVISPEKVLSTSQAGLVRIPGSMGEMGLMPGHTALVAEVGVGELELRQQPDSDGQLFFIAGGYVEVMDDEVKILADICERIEEIDLDRAEKAEARARERIDGKTDLEVDIARALGSLARAKARSKLAMQHKNGGSRN